MLSDEHHRQRPRLINVARPIRRSRFSSRCPAQVIFLSTVPPRLGAGHSGTVQATHENGHVTRIVKLPPGSRSSDAFELSRVRMTAPAGNGKLRPPNRTP